MPAAIINEFNDKINSFIHGKLKIAKNLTTAPICKGGLGFIDLKKFIQSLQCSWVKRAVGSSIDVWRQELNVLAGDDLTILAPEMIPVVSNLLLHTFATAFYEFKRCYFLRNSNFLTSKIWGNPNVLLDQRSKIPVSNNF
jgi:hypothetical protein